MSSQRLRFTGWITGVGTDSGHRLVIGHWPVSPFGPVTDILVQHPHGQRSLYAPTRPLAEFLAGIYDLDQAEVTAVTAQQDDRRWHVQADPVRVSFTVGRRSPTGLLLRAVPRPVAQQPAWARLVDLPARLLLPGVRTHVRTWDRHLQWYGAYDLHLVTAATATLAGQDLGSLRPVDPPVRFGSGSVPRRPSQVHLTTIIEVGT
jgi:hypothetical protein